MYSQYVADRIAAVQGQINARSTVALLHDPVAAKEVKRKAASERMKAMWAKQREDQKQAGPSDV